MNSLAQKRRFVTLGKFLLAAGITLAIWATLYSFAVDVGFRSLAFIFFVNWFLMLWLYLLGKLGTVKLWPGYYAIYAFEQDGRFYKRLGIRRFQKLLRRSFLGKINDNLKLSTPGNHALQQLDEITQTTEAAHALIFVIIGGMSLYALTRQWWDTAIWLFLFNMLHNGYPVLSQRYTRSRLRPLQTRKKLTH